MKFRKILCPTDFSVDSYRGIQKAVEMATMGTTQVCVLHVGPPLPALEGAGEPVACNDGETRYCAEIAMNLCVVLDVCVPHWLRSQPLLKFGRTAEEVTGEIVCAARSEDADLIVLTVSRAEPDSLGAVVQGVLRTAHCPVLIVSPEAYYEPFLEPAKHACPARHTRGFC